MYAPSLPLLGDADGVDGGREDSGPGDVQLSTGECADLGGGDVGFDLSPGDEARTVGKEVKWGEVGTDLANCDTEMGLGTGEAGVDFDLVLPEALAARAPAPPPPPPPWRSCCCLNSSDAIDGGLGPKSGNVTACPTFQVLPLGAAAVPLAGEPEASAAAAAEASKLAPFPKGGL